MPEFVNHFPGAVVDWDIPTHIKKGYARYPGEDLMVGPNRPIRSPASGQLTRPERGPGESKFVKIVTPSSSYVIIREIRDFVGSIGYVEQGDIIGYTSSKWPHYELWNNGVYYSYTASTVENRPTPTPTPPSTTTRIRKETMYAIRSISDDLGTNVWPNGHYIVTERGVYPATSTLAGIVARVAASPIVDFYSSEVSALNAFLVANNPVVGALTSAQNTALMGLPAAIDNMPTNGELSGVITNQYNLLRTGATSDKNEILEAIDEIPGGSTPQNLTVTLTGTAEAAQ